jgi:hypothetical protein
VQFETKLVSVLLVLLEVHDQPQNLGQLEVLPDVLLRTNQLLLLAEGLVRLQHVLLVLGFQLAGLRVEFLQFTESVIGGLNKFTHKISQINQPLFNRLEPLNKFPEFPKRLRDSTSPLLLSDPPQKGILPIDHLTKLTNLTSKFHVVPLHPLKGLAHTLAIDLPQDLPLRSLPELQVRDDDPQLLKVNIVNNLTHHYLAHSDNYIPSKTPALFIKPHPSGKSHDRSRQSRTVRTALLLRHGQIRYLPLDHLVTLLLQLVTNALGNRHLILLVAKLKRKPQVLLEITPLHLLILPQNLIVEQIVLQTKRFTLTVLRKVPAALVPPLLPVLPVPLLQDLVDLLARLDQTREER